MSSTASAEVIPTSRTDANDGRLKDESSLHRIPTLDELAPVSRVPGRGEVITYSGVSFGKPRQNGVTSYTSSPRAKSAPINGLEVFTDEKHPGQIYARVLIIEEGKAVPREALITPLVAVSKQDRNELDNDYKLDRLVESANVEISRFFDGFGPIDSEVKLKEFKEFVNKQDSLRFLFSNLMHRNRGMGLNLFSAYFAPGGAMSGVGVFVNTWL
ncbi:MAG: hypothetical protein L6Q71_10475 [Planctomycetes bacterium]|nr:hypothetical protein [Planctomycetota bacterium]NUQ34811.1 hypothetical protein [Planctomycetaceae bacterium]